VIEALGQPPIVWSTPEEAKMNVIEEAAADAG